MKSINPDRELVTDFRSTVVPIPAERQDARGWNLFINGTLYEGPVGTVDLVNPEYGRVAYGDDPSHRYDGICLYELGGSGQQILPFAILDGKLYVGLVHEWRRNCDDFVLNAPRGWKDPDLSHLASAMREAREEIGVEARGILPTGGEAVNFNSAWAVTFGEEGFEFFAFEVSPEDLVTTAGSILFKNAKAPVQGAGEKIGKCRFTPWHEALLLKDMFTVAGVGRLMRHLIATGRGDVLRIEE